MITKDEDSWGVFIEDIEKILDDWNILDKSRTYITDMNVDDFYSKVNYTAHIPIINRLSNIQCQKLKTIVKMLNRNDDQTIKFDYELTNMKKLWLEFY